LENPGKTSRSPNWWRIIVVGVILPSDFITGGVDLPNSNVVFYRQFRVGKVRYPMARRASIDLQNLFPCKNCLLLAMRRYPGKKHKVDDTDEHLLVFDGRKLIAKESIEKMNPECRFCRGFYLHQVGQLG
jgi:hypothetical protein